MVLVVIQKKEQSKQSGEMLLFGYCIIIINLINPNIFLVVFWKYLRQEEVVTLFEIQYVDFT